MDNHRKRTPGPPRYALNHSGIFGMKWGIRRYQNSDGTLTEEGKRRKRAAYAERTAAERDDDYGTENARSAPKSPREMTDDELRQAINRLKLEKEYRDLSAQTVAKGKTATEKLISTLGTIAAVAAPIKIIADSVGAVQKITGGIKGNNGGNNSWGGKKGNDNNNGNDETKNEWVTRANDRAAIASARARAAEAKTKEYEANLKRNELKKRRS